VRENRWRSVLDRAVRIHQTNDVWQMGAALSFYVMISFVPLVYFSFMLLGAVLGDDAARNDIFLTLVSLTGERIAQSIQSIVAAASSGSGWGFSIFGIMILLYSASSMFNLLRRTLSRLWGLTTGNNQVRDIVIGRWFSMLFTLVIELCLIVLFFLQAVSTIILSLAAAAVPSLSDTITTIGDISVSWITAWFFILLIFRVLPSGRMRWRIILPGSAVTATLFVLGKILLGIYFRQSTTITTLYSAAGSLLVLMVWVFYIAQTFYLGATVTAAWANLTQEQT